MQNFPTEKKYLIIGAGPAGLAGARNLKKRGIPFDGCDVHSAVGGLWNIENPQSTMYESAHLISSKTMTEFTEFPMKESAPDYPSHREMCEYFKEFAEHFHLNEHYRFKMKVKKLDHLKEENLWKVTFENGQVDKYKGVIIANGTLSEPNIPKFKGEFTGELIHSAKYKSADLFRDKRVLIIGAGNSGCDIAVDAIHGAKKVDMSVRRGYYFVPKFVLGKPADAIGGKLTLPYFLKQRVDAALLKVFIGDPTRFGFPKPDYKLYESHPIVNSLILHYLGHGDIKIKADIEEFSGKTVKFKDGTSEEYDLILLSTGYKLHYPFIAKELLNWKGACPELYLNIFHPEFNNLFMLGMVEAAGLGWQGRYEQAELIASFIENYGKSSSRLSNFMKKKKDNNEDLSGGLNYLKLDRMAYYVHKDTYRRKLRENIEELN